MEEKDIKHISVFDDDEIPYEVRMKHLIVAYRKDLKRLGELSRYAKGLEEENLLLQKKLEKIESFYAGSKSVEETISQMKSEIKQLRGAITKTFPKRVIQTRDMRKKIMALEEYIRELQTLLTANDIAYEERQVKPGKAERFNPEEVDIFAVRGPKENYEIEESYCYKYPRPSVTADCIVITRDFEPKVLLIQRGNEPFKGSWAFPGGFMNMDENTEQCAIRELEEETGLQVSNVYQIGVYSNIDRDPRGRTVTVAYLAIIDEPMDITGQDDADKAEWWQLSTLPLLAFDHYDIIQDAIRKYKEVTE